MKKSTLFIYLLFVLEGFTSCNNPESSGIVFYDGNGNRLIAAPTDLGKLSLDGALKACEELELNGYDDWRLPNNAELKSLYRNREKIGGFALSNEFAFSDYYWSSTDFNDGGDNGAWVLSFGSAQNFKFHGTGALLNVRAIRSY